MRSSLLFILWIILSQTPVSGCEQHVPLTVEEQVRIRYGVDDPDLVAAWTILKASGYGFSDALFFSAATFRPPKPGFLNPEKTTSHAVRSGRNDLLQVWDLFIRKVPHLQGNPVFQRDLCALSIEVLSRDLSDLQAKCAHSLAEKEKNGFSKWKIRFLNTLSGLEQVAGSHPAFYATNWNSLQPRQFLSSKGYRQQWKWLFTFAGKVLAAHQKYADPYMPVKPEVTVRNPGRVPDPGLSPAVCVSAYLLNLDADPVDD